MEPILPGLPVEIVGSMIDRSFDFIAGQVGQSLDWKEWKQKNHLTGDQNNFLDVYVEAVVAFSKAEKPKFLKHFFKEQSVVDALYQHWYKNPGSLFYTSLKGLSAHFQIQQQLAEHSLEAEKEIAFFEKCFREAGNYSRTVGEREDSERLKSVAEKMDKLSPSNSKPPRDLNHLPFITIEKQAIGRDEDVDELHHLLQNNQSVSVVRGIGGMGKTTLVKAYLTRYHKNYDHIAWIGEADKLIISVSNDLQLQNRLGLIFGTELPAERFLAVMDALNALNGSNLLILDNANATLSTETLGGRPLNQFLPGSAWKKIATSREHIASMQDF
ncbi:MAG TPA: hypothetical protein PKC40_08195, partial [Saprospiraceae bacterium]|nr:hypothetical protein [Saprospiraceae bacterium]